MAVDSEGFDFESTDLGGWVAEIRCEDHFHDESSDCDDHE